MSSTASLDALYRVRSADLLASSTEEFADLATLLIPQQDIEDLPPISDELEDQLNCFVDGLLTLDEEEALMVALQADPAGMEHLRWHTRWLLKQRLTLDDRARADQGRVVVRLARNSMRWGRAERAFESSIFSQARSGEELLKSLDATRDTKLGAIRITIDLNPDNTCQVTFELTSQPPAEPVSVQRRDAREVVIEAQTLFRQPVRFESVPIGRNRFVFVSNEQELDRIELDLQPEA